MYKLRGKLVVGTFFFLISMGQAYPYAVAYTYDQAVECTCNLKNRKCIHGCDLRKRPKKGHDCHGNQGHEGSHRHFAQLKHQKAHWISPTCSRQHQQKVLSFQGDPFIPVTMVSLPGPGWEVSFDSSSSRPIGPLLACEEEPPKS